MSTLDDALTTLKAASDLTAKGLELVLQHKAEQEAEKKALQDAKVGDEPDPAKP